ncbi:sulfate transporter family protein [Rhizobium alvei]|uniref:Sulfate transporter family protein n=1 Tax=Rhizobium alvei TaxID=1132659 RepID=A0ABT8YFA2_9HYPH|nr:sulfate transporter family protein [Rhizobium alvei]MDO6962376.1 sulfate transporter family protein [Rhizobium alvei]
MIFTAALRAFADVFSPAIRRVFWKVLGLTILALVALWLLVREMFVTWFGPVIETYLTGLPEWAGWLTVVAGFVAAFGLAAAVAMLIAPVSAIMAGLFLDDAAEIIEQRDYAQDAPGKALPLSQSLLSSLRFFLIVVAANLVALLLLLVPGVNLIIFFLVNGYLLGREYFEFAASRILGADQARAFRAANAGTVLVAGFVVALFLFIPILNLLTPLFAAILMVHLNKALAKR